MNEVTGQTLDGMLDRAYGAMARAYVPYSHFQVGACLLAGSGKYYAGCNIENAAFTPTNCAERTAMFSAVYEGERRFDALAVVCSGESIAFPCGVCRQVLAEFCEPDMPVICANRDRSRVVRSTLAELLPHAFGPKDLL